MGEQEPSVKRIDRSNDKRVYQPRLHAERIHQLYELGQQYNLPMTVLLDQAIESFINQINNTEL